MKFLHFILRYLRRARVSKETSIANTSLFWKHADANTAYATAQMQA